MDDAEVSRQVRYEHQAGWDHFGWSCSCGAGRQWPMASTVRARVAAQAHLSAQWRKAYRAARSAEDES